MMLPSTGKFKEINCPFFDSGLCERPYCHFRHVKKESSDILQGPVSAGNAGSPALTLGNNGEILQQLVSEAVRKVLEQTDLPSALTRPSGPNAVESVSRNLVTKVAEVLAPPLTGPSSSQKTYNASTSQQKVPSYKPTPISLLKNRHIPIPYSPSLTKNSSVLRKRSSSDDTTVLQKKLKKEEEDDTTKGPSTFASTSSGTLSKVYESDSESGTDRDPVLDISDSSQYSPAPIRGWRDNGLKYTPSSIETLKQNTYVPSSKGSGPLPVAEYEPSEKLESAVEPTYEPLAANGSSVGDASYEPSGVSNSEPEYQPLCSDNTAKEYVPTDISKLESIGNIDLDFSPEIDLLHDILHKELNGSDSDDPDKKKSESENKEDRAIEVLLKACVSDEHSSAPEKPKNSSEKSKSDGSKKKSDSDRRRNEEKKRSDADRKSDDKRRSESERKSDKKRSDSDKKSSENSSNSSSASRKRIESEKKKEDSDKKKNESKRKSDHNESDKKAESEKKRSEVDKKASSEKKQSSRKKSEGDGNKKRSENEKKKSEGDTKKSESDKKKSVGSKHSDNDKSSSRSHSDHKTSDKNSQSAHSDNKQSSSKSVHERKNDENKKHSQSHKKIASRYSGSNSLQEKLEKLGKSDEYSKSKHVNHKRRRSDAADYVEYKKMKSSNKNIQFEDSRKFVAETSDEVNHGNSVSDSESSDIFDIPDHVTLPNEVWASSSDEETVTKECYRIFQEYEPSNVERKQVPVAFQSVPQEESQPSVPAKRRVAREGAENSKAIRIPTKRSAAPNPSQVLSERFQKIRESHSQAQAYAQAQAQAQAQAFAQTQAQALAQAQVQAQVQAHAQAHAHAHAHGHAQTSLGSPPPAAGHRGNDIKGASAQSTSMAPPAGARKRIAHVPNVSLFLDSKLKMQQKLKEQQLSVDTAGKYFGSSTKAQTVAKGGQRVAHTPSEQVLVRPIVKEIGGKIPSNVRQNYLNILVDEYLKISPNEQEAFEKAEEEERAIYSRSTTRAVYASHVSNTINRLRKTAQANCASTSGKSDGKIINRTVSHTSMLAGKGGTKGSWSIEKPRKPPPSLIQKSLYELLLQFVMTEEQLKQNGFPMSHAEEKGMAVVHSFYKKPFVPKTPQQRMCARCSRVYYVNQQGRTVKEELCVYHWGRLFQSKTRGGWEARYNCCQGHGEAIGCSVGSCHVTDNFDPNNMRGFVKTLAKENPPADGDYGVYALDCEMCYTTVGLELTRVTVIGQDLKVVYETLVRPESEILDYNTRFSGIREEDMVNVTTNIYEVQSVLLSFISDKTILIGHSLESDFKALKLIHSTVVDTSVVYPHKMGPPKKRALKTLCRDLLHKIIQESDGGHDSAEDARAAMEVMLFKVKEELKTAW